jgi:hypothetical protein
VRKRVSIYKKCLRHKGQQPHERQAVQQTRDINLLVQKRGQIVLLSIILVGFLISWAAGCGDAFVDALVYYLTQVARYSE